MLDTLLAGAASVLVGTALGFRLRSGATPDLLPAVQALESHVAILKATTKGLATTDELKQSIRQSESECHTRAANIANKASAEVMEQMLVQLQNSLADCKSELKDEIAKSVGLATAELITRSEVQNAFAQMAQLEAERQQQRQYEQEQAALAMAAQQAAQQARIQEVFGVSRPLIGGLDQQLGELNAQLNVQLGELQQRLNQIRGSEAAVGTPAGGIGMPQRPRSAAPESVLVDPGVS